MAERRQIDLGRDWGFSGIDILVTRKGIEFGGYYDSFVGIEGGFIPWQDFDEARRKVLSKEPLNGE